MKKGSPFVRIVSGLVVATGLLSIIWVGNFSGYHTIQLTKGAAPSAVEGAQTEVVPVNPVASASPAVVAEEVPPVSTVKAHHVPILMYHYIREGVDQKKDPIGYGLSISQAELDQQLGWLQSQGYHSTHVNDLVKGVATEKSVALTFDDGYEDFYTSAFPVLKKYHWSATLYVITGKVGQEGYVTWPQLQEMVSEGIEIGAHTVTHPNLSTLSAEQQRQEIFQSKQTLEENLSISVASFCYPSGKYSDQTLALVKEAGYSSATTTNPGVVSLDGGYDPFTLPRNRVKPDTTPEFFQHWASESN